MPDNADKAIAAMAKLPDTDTTSGYESNAPEFVRRGVELIETNTNDMRDEILKAVADGDITKGEATKILNFLDSEIRYVARETRQTIKSTKARLKGATKGAPAAPPNDRKGVPAE